MNNLLQNYIKSHLMLTLHHHDKLSLLPEAVDPKSTEVTCILNYMSSAVSYSLCLPPLLPTSTSASKKSCFVFSF